VAWPAAERRGRTVVLVLVVVALAALAWAIGGDWLWGLTGLVLMVFALNRWFFPSTFALTPEHLEVGYPLTRKTLKWCDVRRLAISPDGGWISSRSGASRLDARHGLDLYWGRDPEATMAAVFAAATTAKEAGSPIRITDSREGAP
jgi:hypothetical protein